MTTGKVIGIVGLLACVSACGGGPGALPPSESPGRNTDQAKHSSTDLTSTSSIDPGPTLMKEFRTSTNGKGTVLATLTTQGHTVAFVKFLPGLTGVIEVAPQGEPLKVGPIRGQSLSSVYSELSPQQVPTAVAEADADALPQVDSADAAQTAAAPTVASAEGHLPVSHQRFVPETASEQTWFNNTYCNGAHACLQGWDWANSGNINYGSYQVITWVGSEGTSNANLQLFYWDWWTSIFHSGGNWAQFYNAINVPGYTVSVTVTGAEAGNTYAYISGANGTVSLAVR